MKKYEVIDTVALFSGKIGLTKEQFSKRAHNLVLLGGCPAHKEEGFVLCEVMKEVRFKAGEVIVLGKPDKATFIRLKDLEPESEFEETTTKYSTKKEEPKDTGRTSRRSKKG